MTTDQSVRRRLTSLALVSVFALVSLPRSSSAQIVTVPGDLAPGAGYRLIFVTSATRNGASANVADYNAFATGVANAVPALAALGTTWTAVAETATVLAMDNTGTNPDVGGTPTNPVCCSTALRRARRERQHRSKTLRISRPVTSSARRLRLVRAPDGSTAPWVWRVSPQGPELGAASRRGSACRRPNGWIAWRS